MPPPPYVSVVCALQFTAPDVAALQHISLSVSSFLDDTLRLSLEKAAASGSVRLFRRVLMRLQESSPPIDEFLMVHYLCKSMAAAAKHGHLAIAQQIHEIHPGKLYTTHLYSAARNGDLAMVQWILENRQSDWSCVPCLEERDPEIDVLEDPPRCCLGHTFAGAKAMNQFAVMKWLVENGYRGPEGDYLRGVGNSAAFFGALDAVKWLHELNAPTTFSTRAIDEAARAGHTDVVAFLLENRTEGYTGAALGHATTGGHDKMLELLQSPTHYHLLHGSPPTRGSMSWTAAFAGQFDLVLSMLESPEPLTERVTIPTTFACKQGRLDVVKRLVAIKPTTMSSDALEGAAEHGHLHILQWVHEEGGGDFDASVLNKAATHGHLDIVQWFDQHYSDAFTTAVMDNAAIKGHVAIVEWLHFNRTEGCTYRAMDGAAIEGNLQLVKWLHDHRTEGCTYRAMNNAAWNGHLDVVKWLHEHRTEGCTTKAMDRAAGSGHLDVVIWLHQHRTEGCTKEAMDGGPLHVMKWLHVNRTEGCYAAGAMQSAAQGGNLPKLEFLRTYLRVERIGTLRTAMDVTTRGHLYILQWIRHHYPQDFDLAIVSSAARALPKSHPIVTWLESIQ